MVISRSISSMWRKCWY